MFLKKGSLKWNKSIRDFVSHRLNKKEKLILREMRNNGNHCITKFVSFMCNKYGFSKTCIWYNLRKMREDGLIIFGDSKEKGKEPRLTFFGSAIEKNLKGA